MKARKTWILVADGARARLLENDGPGTGVHDALSYEFAASHAPDRARMADKPGKSSGGAPGTGHAIAPKTDWHTFEKARFAHDMAAMLDKAAQDKAFDRLVLVAPPATLGALRKELAEPTRKMVVGELGKDLTHLTVVDVAPYLEEVMRP